MADEIFKSFHDVDSPVQLLGFSPACTLVEEDSPADENGHCWPLYHYRKCTTTVGTAQNTRDIGGTVVPIPKGEFLHIERGVEGADWTPWVTGVPVFEPAIS